MDAYASYQTEYETTRRESEETAIQITGDIFLENWPPKRPKSIFQSNEGGNTASQIIAGKDTRVIEIINDGKVYINSDGQCSCSIFVQQNGYGNMSGYGAAKNWPVNSKEPQIDSVVVTYESAFGHVSLITQIWEETIVVKDFNWIKCKTTIREIRKDSKLIKGYWINN